MGERCKLFQLVRAEPGRQTIFSAFWAENASSEGNFKGTFTNIMFVFSLHVFASNITWGGTNKLTYYVMLHFVTVCRPTISNLLLSCSHRSLLWEHTANSTNRCMWVLEHFKVAKQWTKIPFFCFFVFSLLYPSVLNIDWTPLGRSPTTTVFLVYFESRKYVWTGFWFLCG